MTEKPNRQRLPYPPEQEIPPLKPFLSIPIPDSDTSDMSAKEQLQAGNKNVKTNDNKDGIDDAHAFMRGSYHFDEKIDDTWIPLSERKKIFSFIYPTGALKAKLTNHSYKFATADAGAFRDINDSQPFATESGAANMQDLPFFLKKKVPQVATSNATHRVLVQSGIPTTLNELFLQIKNKEIDEKIIDRLKNDDYLFVAALKKFKELNKEPEKNIQNEWTDIDELESQLEEQEYKIQIGEEFYDQNEIIQSLENELITMGNESFLEKIVGVIKTVATLKQANETNEIPNDERNVEPENKQQTPTKQNDGKRNFWIARDPQTGNFVKEFKSRAEAANFAKVTVASISACLNPSTNNKTAGNYRWSKIRK